MRRRPTRPPRKVLDTTVVYPTYGERQKNEAITKLAQLVKKHGVGDKCQIAQFIHLLGKEMNLEEIHGGIVS